MHLNLTNSKYEPYLTADLDTTCAFSLFAHSVGQDEVSVEPGINLKNSKAKLVHARISTVGEIDTGYKVPLSLSPTLPAYGAAICAKNNSQVELLGSKNLATIITGPFSTARRDAGIYVDKGSSCRVSGPFFIGQFGVAMYANAGSDISFTPHYKDSTNGFDQEGFDLTGQVLNHTAAEVHAYGPCFVVDNNSTLSMRDLGNAFIKYPSAVQSTMDFAGLYNTNTSSYTHAGGMCFFPNVVTQTVTPPALKNSFPDKIKYSSEPHANFVFQSGSFDTGKNYNYYLANSTNLQHANFRTQISTGGPCVEAFGNSVVNVTNVCFHTSDENTDGVVYDYLNSPDGCNDLRYWSFAGGATLNCNHVAVSGTYPSYAGYHGPASVYYNQQDPIGLVPSAVDFSAFSHFPYGYDYGVSTLSGVSFRTSQIQGKADPLTGKVGEFFNDANYIGSSIGTNPYVSGLSVLDFFGLGVNVVNTFAVNPFGGTGAYLPSAGRQHYLRLGKPLLLPTELHLPLSPTVDMSGAGSDLWWGSYSGYENTGPFRLYLEPEPFAHNFRYTGCSSLNDNRAYQTVAQGYHLSGPVSSLSTDGINWTPTKYSYRAPGTQTELVTSALYIGVEDMVRPENYNIRLDESAAHMFANAKHCSIEFLGRPKIVDIFKSTGNQSGGALNELADSGSGAGFKSPHTFDLRRKY